jgi:hypothetical protein
MFKIILTQQRDEVVPRPPPIVPLIQRAPGQAVSRTFLR